MTEPRWCLEFVGGPLDGRRDIVTPMGCNEWIYQTSVLEPITSKPQDISPYAPPFFTHLYRRGTWRSKQGNWRVAQDVWLYKEVFAGTRQVRG